ncbi:S8 family serine peptidase [Alteromonas halophila]|uniref:Uncharacterized protein n=1 Tax=Alteromonas halophila TaxID=516698 RepID=A0A918MY81_9ALTE|nr:S8 family serine peptidase [Alteromonas halophila]GGW82551.1 hypothetical protein GCM10007391_14540 [Alteromonas halophila]
MNLKSSVLSFFPVVTAACLGLHATASAQDAPTSSLKNSLADQLQYVLEAQDRYIIEFEKNAANTGLYKARLAEEQDMNIVPERGFDVAIAKKAVSLASGRVHKVIEDRAVIVASLDSHGLEQLRQRDDIKRISPDPVRELFAQTQPYSHAMIEATELVQSETDSVKVCVIDTGIDEGHEDLPDRADGLTGTTTGNAVGEWFNDGFGHGTHVAGIIAAYDNTFGSVGIYPGVRMHVVKIFNDDGNWTYASNVIEAVQQCADAGANVINMSFGGPGKSSYEEQNLIEFESQGLIMVGAAGNDGSSSKAYPASYDAVMSVAALKSDGYRAGYSQHNDAVEIAAPGSGIYSTYPGYGYRNLSGTSMAAPHVTAGAALLWSFFPECSGSQIRKALTRTALDKGATGRDTYYGHGMLRVQASYEDIAAYGCDGDDGSAQDGGSEPQRIEVVKDNLSVSAGKWLRYWADIPANVRQLKVTLSGGEGNADLFVNRGREVTPWHWDCYSASTNNEELCLFETPAADKWSIGIRANSDVSGSTLTYSYLPEDSTDAGDDGDNGDNGNDPDEDVVVEKTNLSVLAGRWSRNWWVSIPDNVKSLTVKLTGGSGNAELYVNKGREVTSWHWKCRSNGPDNEELCTIDNPKMDKWNIGIWAKTDVSGLTLQYAYSFNDDGEDDGSDEGDGVTIVKDGLTLSGGNWLRYKVTLPSGTLELDVSLSGVEGNAALYVHKGRDVTPWHWTCKSDSGDAVETCHFDNPATNTYWSLGIRASADIEDATLSYSYK